MVNNGGRVIFHDYGWAEGIRRAVKEIIVPIQVVKGNVVENCNSCTTINCMPLEKILEKHPLFHKSRFIKIDTDGFDCNIIRSMESFLRFQQPVVFFEYAPVYLCKVGDDGISVFDMLHKIGYYKAMIYTHTGEYLLTIELANKSALEDIHYFYTNASTYCDICIFHKEDDGLAEEIRSLELQYFTKNKV